MIAVDFVFGAAFPCCFCGELTAHGITGVTNWVSVCKRCASFRKYEEIAEHDEMYKMQQADSESRPPS
jgi:hypothetical protein